MSLEKILSIPQEVELLRNKSIYDLVSQYIDISFTENNIINFIKNNRKIIELWFLYCENKRTDEGWVIEKNFFFFEVCYLRKNNKTLIRRFLSKNKAISYFIYEEILSIFKNNPAPQRVP